MALAAKTMSQVALHMGVAFILMYGISGSIAFGGLAALIEPVCNVGLVPLHKRLWGAIRQKIEWASDNWRAIAAEKISQVGLHMTVAFGVIYWASGSLTFGGFAAVVEPICAVVLLGYHDKAWEKMILSHKDDSSSVLAALAK